MSSEKFLHIYLTDHHAGALAGYELAKRCLSNNESGSLGDFLGELVQELQEDRNALEAIMQQVGARANPLKTVAAWSAEKAGRLKLNGRLTGYSPLSRVIELEGLRIGVDGKLSMWETLDTLSASHPKLAGNEFTTLILKAKSQKDRLEHFRKEAAVLAFGP